MEIELVLLGFVLIAVSAGYIGYRCGSKINEKAAALASLIKKG
jgi:hypothetical protein